LRRTRTCFALVHRGPPEYGADVECVGRGAYTWPLSLCSLESRIYTPLPFIYGLVRATLSEAIPWEHRTTANPAMCSPYISTHPQMILKLPTKENRTMRKYDDIHAFQARAREHEAARNERLRAYGITEINSDSCPRRLVGLRCGGIGARGAGLPYCWCHRDLNDHGATYKDADGERFVLWEPYGIASEEFIKVTAALGLVGRSRCCGSIIRTGCSLVLHRRITSDASASADAWRHRLPEDPPTAKPKLTPGAHAFRAGVVSLVENPPF
jgi:hypothetical protein